MADILPRTPVNIFAYANLLCIVLAKISAARVEAGANLEQSVIQESHPSGRCARGGEPTRMTEGTDKRSSPRRFNIPAVAPAALLFT